MKKARTKRWKKRAARKKSQTLTAGWGVFFVLVPVFGVVVWLTITPFFEQDALIFARLGLVLVVAVIFSGLATYILNSLLAAWSKWQRKRS